MLSVALNIDGRTTAQEMRSNRDHNLFVLSFIQELLASARMRVGQIDAIAYGDGPGSYTGLRVAAGVVQGVAFGVARPALPVSCMAAIAQAQKHDKVLVTMDAKKNKLFAGRYIRDGEGVVRLQGEEELTEVSSLELTGNGWVVTTDGESSYEDELRERFGDQVTDWISNQQPHAIEIAKLGADRLQGDGGVSAQLAIPRYLSPYLSG